MLETALAVIVLITNERLNSTSQFHCWFFTPSLGFLFVWFFPFPLSDLLRSAPEPPFCSCFDIHFSSLSQLQTHFNPTSESIHTNLRFKFQSSINFMLEQICLGTFVVLLDLFCYLFTEAFRRRSLASCQPSTTRVERTLKVEVENLIDNEWIFNDGEN